jgi:hypothetical protein
MFAAFFAALASTDFSTRAVAYFASVWTWPG